MNEQDRIRIWQRAAALGVALTLTLGAGLPAGADDIELFVATQSPGDTGARPNILFVIDTSGSMTAEVLTQEDWDPNRAWDGCFDADGVYFSTTNTNIASWNVCIRTDVSI